MKPYQLRRLISQAQNGSESARQKVNDYVRAVAPKVNKRLTRIRKAGITSRYLNNAEYFLGELGRERFSSKKDLFLEDYGEEEIMLLNTLYINDLTVTKLKDQQDRTINTLVEHGVIDRPDDQRLFFEFLSTDLFTEFALFDSGRAMETVAEKLHEPRALDVLVEKWRQYQTGNMTLKEAWEEFEQWVPVK